MPEQINPPPQVISDTPSLKFRLKSALPVLIPVLLVLVAGSLFYFWNQNQKKIIPDQSIKSSEIKLTCPAPREFCQSGQDVIKDGGYVGFGGQIASGSAIYAAFDGDLDIGSLRIPTPKGKEKLWSLSLDNKTKDLHVEYFFKGEPTTVSGPVKEGDQIAVASGEPIEFYDGNTLIFSLIEGYPGTQIETKLVKEDFR